MPVIWPLILFFFLAAVTAVGMVALSFPLGETHKELDTDKPFESGVQSTGGALVRFDVKFYMQAMFFVVFDLEIVFLFAWAVVARPLGWPGYISAVIFIVVLLAALAYLWRVGALEWGTRVRRTRRGK